MSKTTIRNLLAAVLTAIFSVTLFDAIYNVVGTKIAPNMVTAVIFDFRAYDTLGESIILLSAGLVVLLIFGRGLLGDKR